LDPYTGTIGAVAEAARNVACTGASPMALTNCLNFGNPERPEIMWEFAEATRGIGAAAEALGTPVVSGNVSFYNETSGRAIFPTPTIGVVGLLDRWERHAVSHFDAPGRAIVLLGKNCEELGGSDWLALRRGIEAGLPPAVDLAAEGRLHKLLAAGVEAGEIATAHDVSCGGLAVALAECTFIGRAPVGAVIELSDTIRPDALLYGETTGRVIVTTRDTAALLARADEFGVPAQVVGETGGDRLVVSARGGEAWFDLPIEQMRNVWRDAIPRRLEEP
jgi:phosphoribosylformylglycinamidine synthase